MNSFENLENEKYSFLLNRIESLTDFEVALDYQISLREINNRIDQEEEIKKEISSLVNEYKKLISNLESQRFLELGLPVYEESERTTAAKTNTENLNSLLDKKIKILKNKRVEINKQINSDKTWGTIFDFFLYSSTNNPWISWLFSYRSGKNSTSDANDSENNAKLRELNLKIKLLESKIAI